MNHRVPPSKRAVRWGLVAVAAAAPLVAPALALAQAAPQPALNRAPNPIIGYGIMALLLVVVVAISFMPSKRGHQD